ncbi:MAG: hypothetical protein V1891_02145 [bacterium]
MQEKQVAVLGSSNPDKWTSEQAERLGGLLATKGWTVVNGGYNGVMEDVSRGAVSAGGKVIGVTVAGIETKNLLLTEKVEKSFWERLKHLLEMPRIFFSPRGSVGSVLELAAALHKCLFLGQLTIMIAEEGDNIFDILRQLFGEVIERNVIIVHSAEEAVSRLSA